MRIAGIALATLVGTASARAEMPEPHFAQARAVIRAYAVEMTEAVPCIYVAVSGSPLLKNVGDWYSEGVLLATEKLRGRGASGTQIAVLLEEFEASFKPEWISDIRVLARRCTASGIADQLARMEGPGLPLFLRDPFR